MIIEKTDKEIILRISNTVDTDDLQEIVDYVKYKELTTNNQLGQDAVDGLARELNGNWWKENRSKFIK